MITGNEPAMPFASKTMVNLSSEDFIGLTIRQHFAAMAMQGLLTRVSETGVHLGILESKRIAEESVVMADNIIAELNKPQS